MYWRNKHVSFSRSDDDATKAITFNWMFEIESNIENNLKQPKQF